MIIKASQRAFGAELAAHLLRADDNEHVLVHELRGFASDDLKEAFKEAEAISKATKCRQYLFSVSFNPPEEADLSVADFEDAIGRVESRLGLDGQPRAVVFHEKEGRRHAHCVWSRIDADTMTARHMSFFKTKLMGISRDLYLDHGWSMPRGLENTAERNPTNFSLAEWQQAKRQGIDPRWIKSTLQECWNRSDSQPAFSNALEERGFALAKGDKRGFVVLDYNGEVYSLPRMLDQKTRVVRERLGTGENLQNVNDAKAAIGERMTPAMRRHIAESREQFQRRSATLGQYKQEMTRLHRKARGMLDEKLTKEWDRETHTRAARLPKGLRGLWHRITGQYQKVRRVNENEAEASRQRQAAERDKLIAEQRRQRAVLQAEFKKLRQQQAQQLNALRKDIGRYRKFTASHKGQSARRDTAGPRLGHSLKL